MDLWQILGLVVGALGTVFGYLSYRLAAQEERRKQKGTFVEIRHIWTAGGTHFPGYLRRYFVDGVEVMTEYVPGPTPHQLGKSEQKAMSASLQGLSQEDWDRFADDIHTTMVEALQEIGNHWVRRKSFIVRSYFSVWVFAGKRRLGVGVRRLKSSK